MTTMAATPPGQIDTAADAVYRKVAMRLIPLLFLCYIAAYLDRVNVGFAKLQMQQALQFSDSVYGFGAGIFFIGYFIFEIPSNVLLHKVGAGRWIAASSCTSRTGFRRRAAAVPPRCSSPRSPSPASSAARHPAGSCTR